MASDKVVRSASAPAHDVVDRPAVAEHWIAIAEAATRFTELVRTMPAPRARVDEQWCCADVAAHVGIVVRSYGTYLSGDETPILDYRDLSGSNARTLLAVPSRDPATLAASIDDATAAFLRSVTAREPTEQMPWHGTRLPIRAVGGIYLAELLIHGRDIARANHMPWTITNPDAALALDGAITASPHFVNPTRTRRLTAVYRLHLRGAGDYDFHFDGGQLTLNHDGEAGRHVDCRISASPPAMLLVVYHRNSQWRHIVAGRLIATGRRPWLGLRFADLFTGF